MFKSRKAFSCIIFKGAESARASVWYEKKTVRDREARKSYRKTKRTSSMVDELFMIDIMREGIKNGDPRLR